MKAHYEQHGDFASLHKDPLQHHLQKWVYYQNLMYRDYLDSKERGESDAILQEKMDLLQSINFEFEDPSAIIKPQWMHSYELLKKHLEDHGNLVINLADPAQAALQYFIKSQGKLFRKLQENDDQGYDGPNGIEAKKIKLLRALNFDFHTLNGKISPSWMATYGLLKEHFQKHGSYSTLQYKMPLERKLIRFIRDQRFRYKKVHANLEPGQEIDPVYKEKFKLLEEIQFEFKSKRKGRPKSDWIEAGWMANYGMLKEHFQKHGSYATLQYKMPL
eukprot:CAMPEP_0113319686 /NCGR_PEP_ID=MMETSP0010_2-20120614/13789_1 /TAXON_ID=216773 ORGANISM="Corethron hystrix, Strain 308" /NCGR_SAMPLE_ID=MMETSP0010_2 /ASSEMBLY_ACC=CAM_ASM_000155 /LENGTH=273 /DNA_ID=CAMNT_0000177305 /DNA_START=6 /DNA_END=823 /DNA_ORIENTATION=- /assembly_acc=CAM_ASM_000155